MALATQLGQQKAVCEFVGDSHLRDTWKKIAALFGVDQADCVVDAESGNTARQHLASLRDNLTPTRTPDILIIWIGANDLDTQDASIYQDCATVHHMISDIVHHHDGRGTRVYVLNIVPCRFRPWHISAKAYLKRANKVNKNVFTFMEKHFRPKSFINVCRFCLKEVSYKADGFHLREAVRDEIAKCVASHILTDLSKV
ncbi:unnamed protein product [Meganyctiphanes norvegica]|uniref:SGNH hydrolase-type esterase domain-containing protein n=1 Tax=Meganyctiphanes norvegica TaxID=48144 RepID=A0AAV2RUV9_MEGNR